MVHRRIVGVVVAVKEYRITALDLLHMSADEFETTWLSLYMGALHLLGIPYQKWWLMYRDPQTRDIVIQYE